MKSLRAAAALALGSLLMLAAGSSLAQPKPNILLIVSDDTGYGDLGPYGGGVGRGMPTPSIDRMAAEGMTFFCTRTSSSTIPRRAGFTTNTPHRCRSSIITATCRRSRSRRTIASRT